MKTFKIGDILENSSKKVIQFPNRLSSDFNWSPKERVNVIEILDNGYRVHNQDYCGNYQCYETAFIDFETIQNFNKIGEIRNNFYHYL